jgi:hypothetical protein
VVWPIFQSAEKIGSRPHELSYPRICSARARLQRSWQKERRTPAPQRFQPTTGTST